MIEKHLGSPCAAPFNGASIGIGSSSHTQRIIIPPNQNKSNLDGKKGRFVSFCRNRWIPAYPLTTIAPLNGLAGMTDWALLSQQALRILNPENQLLNKSVIPAKAITKTLRVQTII